MGRAILIQTKEVGFHELALILLHCILRGCGCKVRGVIVRTLERIGLCIMSSYVRSVGDGGLKAILGCNSRDLNLDRGFFLLGSLPLLDLGGFARATFVSRILNAVLGLLLFCKLSIVSSDFVALTTPHLGNNLCW